MDTETIYALTPLKRFFAIGTVGSATAVATNGNITLTPLSIAAAPYTGQYKVRFYTRCQLPSGTGLQSAQANLNLTSTNDVNGFLNHYGMNGTEFLLFIPQFNGNLRIPNGDAIATAYLYAGYQYSFPVTYYTGSAPSISVTYSLTTMTLEYVGP
jgi:hypothetical protein